MDLSSFNQSINKFFSRQEKQRKVWDFGLNPAVLIMKVLECNCSFPELNFTILNRSFA